MGCQKTIAEKIVTKQADYIMGLKDNQAALSLATFTAFQEHDKQAENSKAHHLDFCGQACHCSSLSFLPKRMGK